MNWTAIEPPGTSVAFQVRASTDPYSMGSWSDTLFSPCSLDGILTDGDSLLQYRAILSTSDCDSTPTVNDITIGWNTLGIENTRADNFILHGAVSNPVESFPVLQFTLSELSLVSIHVYDLSGRKVCGSVGEYPEGLHTMTVDPLEPGIYFVQMKAGDFESVQSFVVIE